MYIDRCRGEGGRRATTSVVKKLLASWYEPAVQAGLHFSLALIGNEKWHQLTLRQI